MPVESVVGDLALLNSLSFASGLFGIYIYPLLLVIGFEIGDCCWVESSPDHFRWTNLISRLRI